MGELVVEDLHKLEISSPDGHGHSGMVKLDGVPVQISYLAIEMGANELTTATLVFPMVAVEFEGKAFVRSENERLEVGDDADAEQGSDQERHDGGTASGDVRSAGS